jgi:chromosome segregation protein
MYLKRLELQGFKSFLSRTALEFAPGMTAVVGPNGVGKSNIAEALRWVLGEQANRNVRARRLEDIIFSGSSQKAAMGMAEVSITLDNADAWLPLDYSEVVVTRRAYRNGESEYLVNKNRVRLRDVVDLFLRAEVGQNSYAFMGQGLVEEVLLMRPEERRRLLEEAADVRLLRSRLDEARDRLAATRENLERVNLLLDEIGPRLQQLERQAARAGEHERLARDLAQALQALFGHLWSEGQEALAAARARSDQLQQGLLVVRAEVKACEEGLSALAGAIEERQSELESRRGRHRELSDTAHSLEQRLLLERERAETLGRRRAELEEETKALKLEESDLTRALLADQEREKRLAQEIEEADVLVEARRRELNEVEQETAALRRRVWEAEERIGRAQRLQADAETALGRLQEDEARVQGEALRRTQAKKELIARLRTYGREYGAALEAEASAAAALAAAEQERLGLASMADSARSSFAALDMEAGELRARAAELQARRELLVRLQAAREGVESGARVLLGDDPANETAVDGLIGLVRDIVRVPPGLELAIEAALAENVQALVFDNLKMALAALDLLERREAGRALLYPLDAIKPAPPLNLLRERGIVGVAARLVRCENRFRPLVDTLLGRTIVVEDLSLAQQVLRRGLGSVVTMDGKLLRPAGAVSGGRSRAATEAFSRQRELEEIPHELSQLESALEDIERRLARQRDALAGASEALSRVEVRIEKLRDDVAARRGDLLRVQGGLILLAGEARSLWGELRRSEGQATDWRERLSTLRAERARYASQVRQESERLRQDREALEVLTPRRSEAVDAVAAAAAAHAALDGERRSLAREAEGLRAALARVQAQTKSREEGLRSLDAELKALTSRTEARAAELAAARTEIESLAADLAPAREEVEQLVGRERSMREQLASARARLLELERAHLEAEAALKLKTEEMEALREAAMTEGISLAGPDALTAERPSESRPRIPPVRGAAPIDAAELRERIVALRLQIRGLGPVNEQAPTDYTESKERYDFLRGQVEDLQGSEANLLAAIEELESNIRQRLKTTFATVDDHFQRYFGSFFQGGKARLVLTQPDDLANSGIEIQAQPPGKRVQTLTMLSGGERALTAVALLFALLEAHPSPICVLDEVDAALDDSNVSRFVEALRALAERTQFIVITHNPRTIEAADVIYGVAMGVENTSRVLSLRLGEPSPE